MFKVNEGMISSNKIVVNTNYRGHMMEKSKPKWYKVPFIKLGEISRDTLERWYSLWGALLLLIIIWLSLGIYDNWDKDSADIAFIVIKGAVELAIFYIGIKIVLGLNSVVASIGESFKHIFLKREFFGTLSRTEMLHIAKDIHKQDQTILFLDKKDDADALKNTINTWKEEDSSKREKYIVLESWSNETLYASEQLIIHRKFKIKMMEDGKFKSLYKYMPFDEDVKEITEENKDEKYYVNIPGDRWSEKAFQYHLLGNSIGELACEVSTEKSDKDQRLWVVFAFETEELKKDQEFTFEFSISDKITLTNKERSSSYFNYSFAREKHAIRHIAFQIETYNDMTNPCIRLEPRMYKDCKLMVNNNNCCESLFYKKWEWTIRNLKDEPKEISYKLISPGRNLSQCGA